MTLLTIFRYSSDVFHNRLQEMGLVTSLYVKYHELTKGANKYCFHYENISENCGPLRLEDNARKHTENKKKILFYIKLLRLSPLTV